jgi:hypothetical protein
MNNNNIISFDYVLIKNRLACVVALIKILNSLRYYLP